jgi:hypothetical protein
VINFSAVNGLVRLFRAMIWSVALFGRSVARSGLTDLVPLRHVPRQAFKTLDAHRMAQSKRRRAV